MENNNPNNTDESSKKINIQNPSFDTDKFKSDIRNEIKQNAEPVEPLENSLILKKIIEQIEPVNFKEEARFNDKKAKVKRKHYLVSGIEAILQIAQQNGWGICKHNYFVYLYNGSYWSAIEKDELEVFFGEAVEKMGVDKFDARLYSFREQLSKQFMAIAYLAKPPIPKETVLINLKNGTFEISPTKQVLRPADPKDFITYQLPFEFNPTANAKLFEKYLDKVLPYKANQKILAEYLGSLFINRQTLKIEKALLLYGDGANGKSVFFDVVTALLGGDKNVSYFSLQNLTDVNGYYRAMFSNKLLNYASEISRKLESSIFKQLVSGEPVEARLPGKDPFSLTKYGKLIFNCNELPKDAELTHAFFRRLLIIAFEITIPDSEQDSTLSNKIIEAELSGVFNWILDGLRRLLLQKGFTESDSVKAQLELYKIQADNVKSFLNEEDYEKHIDDYIEFKEFYGIYRLYCTDCGNHACSKRTFGERLRKMGYSIEKKNYGLVIFVKKVPY